MLANHHESILILTELTSVFTDEKDAQLILDIKEKEKVFRERHEAKQREVKNAIKALTADLHKIESKMQRKEPKEHFESKVEALANEKEATQSNVDLIERNIKKLEDDMGRLVLLEQKIDNKLTILARDAEGLFLTESEIGLYCAVTNVEWFDTGKKGIVEGSTSDPSLSRIPMFCLQL